MEVGAGYSGKGLDCAVWEWGVLGNGLGVRRDGRAAVTGYAGADQGCWSVPEEWVVCEN
jgi:hypothetical protein